MSAFDGRRASSLASLLALVGMLGVAGSPDDPPRDPPPPKRRPPPRPPSDGAFTFSPFEPPSGNAFHDHLDVCARCRDNPFGLCAVGAEALRREALREGPFARMPATPEPLRDEVEWRMPPPRIAPMSPAQSIRIAYPSDAEERAIRKRDRKRALRLARKAGAK